MGGDISECTRKVKDLLATVEKEKKRKKRKRKRKKKEKKREDKGEKKERESAISSIHQERICGRGVLRDDDPSHSKRLQVK